MAAGNITEYNSPVDKLQPSNLGAESAATAAVRANRLFTETGASEEQLGRQAGKDIGGAIQATGDAEEDYLTHKEVSHGSAAEAALLDSTTKQWDDTIKNADPNDPNVASKFVQNVLTPNLTQFKNGFSTERGQDWAQARSERLTEHFQTLATQGMQNLAGAAVKTNLNTLQNSWTNAAIRDPGNVPFLLGSIPDHVNSIINTSPNLGGEALARAKIELPQQLRQAIIKAGAQGAIQSSGNPEAAAAAWTAKYPDDINGAEAQALAKEARFQLRLGQAETRAAQAETRRQNTDAYHKAANEFELSLTKTDANGQLVPNTPKDVKKQLTDLARMPDADPSRTSALIAKVEHDGVVQDETTRANIEKTSEATQARLFEDTRSGKITDPSAYDDEYAKGKGTTLTWPALQQLKANFYADKSQTGQAIAGARTDYLKANEGNIDPARIVANLKSGEGSVAINRAEQALRQQEAVYRAQNKDPQELYNYDSNGHSPADDIISKFKVPLSALPGNLQKMLGADDQAPIGGGAPPTPPALKGIASLGWSSSKKLFKDQSTGALYNADGTRYK